MTEDKDDSAERLSAYRRYRDQLLARQMKNSETYDRAILSLSSGALTLSLSFIREIVPTNQSHAYLLLIISWILFSCSIVLTLFSYPISQQAIGQQLIYADKYYMDRQDDYANKGNCWSTVIAILGVSAGLAFIAAFICTIVFVSINLQT